MLNCAVTGDDLYVRKIDCLYIAAERDGHIPFAADCLFGLYSYLKLPIDAFPDVTNIQVEVVSHADGLSAIEIEERNVPDRDGHARVCRTSSRCVR